MKFLVLILFSFFLPSICLSQNTVSKKHLIILESGVDKIWGTYLCAIDNPSGSPQKAKFSILLPLEAKEWQAQEGVANENIKLNPDGGLMVEQEFKPGNTLIGIAFWSEASNGFADYKFRISSEIAEFVIMTPLGGLGLNSTQMEAQKNLEFSNQQFNSLVAKSLQPGQELNVQISEVQMGRKLLWWVGGGFIAILLLLSFFLTLKTRPVGSLTD
jgi:hypothetical protein